MQGGSPRLQSWVTDGAYHIGRCGTDDDGVNVDLRRSRDRFTADGETVAATAGALRTIEQRWAEFHRALRQRNQPRFDQLLQHAREHADASGLLNYQNPLPPALFSIDLEQEARLDDHEQWLENIEQARTRENS
jgi:hypothetical protein